MIEIKDGFYLKDIKPNEINNIDWKDGIIQLNDGCVDLVVTDPPYGMKFVSNHRKEKHKAILDDDNLDWVKEWVESLKRVCKPDAHLYIFISFHNVDFFKIELSKQFNVKNILIWEKNNTGMGDLEGDYAPKYEMIIFCSNGTKKLNGRRDSNIIKCARTQNEDHPTEKPVSIIKFLIEKSSNPGDVVLDTFAGSFPTLKSCIELNRVSYCFEIEESYCNIASKKIKTIQKGFFN